MFLNFQIDYAIPNIKMRSEEKKYFKAVHACGIKKGLGHERKQQVVLRSP